MKLFVGIGIVGAGLIGYLVGPDLSLIGMAACAALLVYLILSFVASYRGHHQTTAIFMLNLFLGWSFLGWVGALVWASTATK